ncbi:ribosome biogenesis GTPase Der [Tenacibaculum finnmarkense]|uniref:ribosome biogenesis GTPase Der n=1 Tax=Tenacibaculum finnmarkense TaxID=2781243 RepID=UPI00187B897A|nr:ribosome biogenesis GTPase Der [Tenacibaculum finnmarkense]MBE7688357.1 ribosome biogenesis GTPase Der [Tenacibaculum finnmarkense genomovar ulcerans]MCD8400421.1 ribosome biogenesis GTPase Der [Tenacibaculum finnmarkense genomovar ulcerans]MCD8410299.1 ribosome biogenesis GTPase Der [Tenacibaculum finnmarkense genomovar ulcerans]MCD8422840.1 ribosome biogenesis GTPase Der [Tenacibaculum finnmarkense genomovar ulcerans]MCD8432832.1 ribosome biogenesis GTPase Der [Tenacibaculum finnmarkense 
MSSIVAIVGRPNVGKSTLFNRLVQRREAIVDSVSGVTRDRHYGKSEWNGKEFSVIDTGGYIVGSDDIFEGEIRKQVQLAIEEADIIVFVVDVEQGITPMDDEVAKILRQVKKPIIMAVNKVDNAMRDADAVEFYNLGLGEYHTISSINGSGTGELLDAVAKEIPEEEETEAENELPRFAIVGRPNAGKSSFINALIGEDRNIVTNIAGTTRDSIDTKYNRYGFEFNLVDTAGIRKKSKVKEDLEFYSVMRAVRAIEHCDVAVLVVDATRDFEGQDEKIFWLAEKNKKGVVILVNKWDLVEKETNTMRDFEAHIRKKIAPFSDVPIVFTSVLTKQRIFKAIETAVEVFENRKRRIQTSKLNETMLEILEQNPPPAIKGKYIKIKYCMQLPTYTPQFAFFANLPQYVRDPYRRYLENQLRQHYNFNGVPIIIYFRQK